jgi:hypothetical protein
MVNELGRYSVHLLGSEQGKMREVVSKFKAFLQTGVSSLRKK